ncbi:hypothetical protein J7K93_01640 [bacterium]|nr:hypothetical protein [bacterium]
MMIKLNKKYIGRTGFLLVGIILIFVTGALLAGEETPVTISSAVDKSRIKIGDVITYTVTVSYLKNVEVKAPGAGENLGAFEIRNYKISDPEKENGRTVLKAEYKISTFSTGDYFIPPVTVYYKLAGDTSVSAISTEKIRITVESMKPSEEGDIRDIKGPVEIYLTFWEKIRPFVFGIGLILFLAAGYFMYRLKKEGKSLLPERKEPPRPPHEIALERLDELKESNLVADAKIKEFHIRLSDIIRRYISGRYYVPAPEMTTSEISNSFRSGEIPSEQYDMLMSLLFQCDMVKFAKVIPVDSECIGALDTAYKFVNETKIVIVDMPDGENDIRTDEKLYEAAVKQEEVVNIKKDDEL